MEMARIQLEQDDLGQQIRGGFPKTKSVKTAAVAGICIMPEVVCPAAQR